MTTNSARSTGASAAPRIALSWADVLLVLLVLAAGIEACRIGDRLATFVFADDTSPVAEIANEIAAAEQRTQRAQTDAAALRTAFNAQQLATERDRATIATLQKIHPGIEKSGTDRTTLPTARRDAFDQAQLNLAVSAATLPTLREALARAESDHAKEAASLRNAQRKRDDAAAEAKRGLDLRRRILGLAITLAAILLVYMVTLVVLRLAARASLSMLHPARVRPLVFSGLVLVAAYMVIGSVGLLLVALGAVLLVMSRTGPKEAAS